MALVLTVQKNSDDYVLVEHGGERVRIAINDQQNPTRAAVVLMADDSDSKRAPNQSRRLLRKAVREREDGGV